MDVLNRSVQPNFRNMTVIMGHGWRWTQYFVLLSLCVTVNMDSALCNECCYVFVICHISAFSSLVLFVIFLPTPPSCCLSYFCPLHPHVVCHISASTIVLFVIFLPSLCLCCLSYFCLLRPCVVCHISAFSTLFSYLYKLHSCHCQLLGQYVLTTVLFVNNSVFNIQNVWYL